jgi:hypothetical protein
MALMLRELGIPSRNVTGFVGGTYNRFGHYYAVREGDAHSWVEAYVEDPRPGWQTFDPTPSAGAQPLQETTGVFVYLRDLVEALSQRWNRYVVGYDLRTQIRIFDDLSKGYERLRASAGVNRGPFERLTRAPALAATLLMGVFAAYYLWRRRIGFKRAGRSEQRPTKQDRNLQNATALYHTLETALVAQGIHRPTSLPPLRHAHDLRTRSHPLADEVLALTEVYLEARFGGTALTDNVRRDFERRVREIRAYRPDPPASAAAPAT